MEEIPESCSGDKVGKEQPYRGKSLGNRLYLMKAIGGEAKRSSSLGRKRGVTN